jgi:Lrp/AsnC family transcriptional regulator for asnA, asnC and gidA
MKIDIINATILKELLKDGRKSFAEIAKECNTSKDVIAKRYKQMKSKGIIVGATIQNSCACYGCGLVAGIYIYTQPHKADHVLQLVHKIPQVFDVYSVGINPSLVAIVVMKNIEELDQVKQSIKKLPFISGVDTKVWTGVRNMPENLSILTPQETALKTDNENRKTKSNLEKTAAKIDEIDKQIIEKLAANARMPFMKIAKAMKVSTDTVVRRYERLKQNGDLKVVIQINPIKIGYYAYATFSIAFISQDSLVDSIEALAKIPDINNIIKTSGNFDYTISLMVRDIEQLTTIQEEIVNIPGITNMEIAVEKLFNVWPLPREFISTF